MNENDRWYRSPIGHDFNGTPSEDKEEGWICKRCEGGDCLRCEEPGYCDCPNCGFEEPEEEPESEYEPPPAASYDHDRPRLRVYEVARDEVFKANEEVVRKGFGIAPEKTEKKARVVTPPKRETSREALASVESDPNIGGAKRKVYRVLYEHGPLTANEVNRALGGSGFHKRLSELERLGTVRKVERRICNVSGKRCDAWDVTPDLPTEKPTPRVQRTHSVFAVGQTPSDAFNAFAATIGWEPVEGLLKDLPKPPKGLSWAKSFHDKNTNEDVTVGGMALPGGVTLTYFK